MAELAQKILNNIGTAFTNDPLIDEYDFLPVVEPKYNKNPVIVEHHKLGIEAWAVNAVYKHCYNRLLPPGRLGRRTTTKGKREICEWSRIVVMVVADCATAWNIRKELIQTGYLDMKQELSLTRLVLNKHPKSSDTFYHRKWLLASVLSKCNNPYSLKATDTKDKHAATQGSMPVNCSVFQGSTPTTSLPTSRDGHLVKNDECSVNDPSPASNHHAPSHDTVSEVNCHQMDPEVSEMLLQEFEVCQCTAEKYANNYHAWTHRIWILQHGLDKEMADREMTNVDKFLLRHVSDYSAYHYKQHLLRCVGPLQPASDHRDLLYRELALCQELLLTYPGHEAIWYYRRALLSQLTCHMTQSHDDKAGVKRGSVPKKLKCSADCLQSLELLLADERSFCRRVQEECDLNPTAELRWQRTLASRHVDAVNRAICNHR